MGELVSLDGVRAVRRLEEEVRQLRLKMETTAFPSPESLDWRPTRYADDGGIVQWHNLRYRAFIGYASVEPEWAYLDYQNRIRAYALTIEELATAVETGTLPAPMAELDGLGRPIE